MTSSGLSAYRDLLQQRLLLGLDLLDSLLNIPHAVHCALPLADAAMLLHLKPGNPQEYLVRQAYFLRSTGVCADVLQSTTSRH
jgi:hypothetical protein